MKNYQKRIWEQLHATPNKTGTELGILMGVEQATVSHYLTQLFRRKMVERKHRTFINDNARQQTCNEYCVVGTKYVVKPIVLVPANPRKHYAATDTAPQEITQKDIPDPATTVSTPSYDIENMTVKQARALRDQLNEFFGSNK